MTPGRRLGLSSSSLVGGNLTFLSLGEKKEEAIIRKLQIIHTNSIFFGEMLFLFSLVILLSFCEAVDDKYEELQNYAWKDYFQQWCWCGVLEPGRIYFFPDSGRGEAGNERLIMKLAEDGWSLSQERVISQRIKYLTFQEWEAFQKREKRGKIHHCAPFKMIGRFYFSPNTTSPFDWCIIVDELRDPTWSEYFSSDLAQYEDNADGSRVWISVIMFDTRIPNNIALMKRFQGWNKDYIPRIWDLVILDNE